MLKDSIKMAKQNEEVFTSNSVVFIQVDQSVIFDFTTKNDDQMVSLRNKAGTRQPEYS